MLTNEQFPVGVTYTSNGAGHPIIDQVEIPPYHPSMGNGINLKMINPKLRRQVLEQTLTDFEGLTKIPDIEHTLRRLEDSRNGITSTPDVEGGKITIDRFPFSNGLVIKPHQISSAENEDTRYIAMRIGQLGYFKMPSNVCLPPELMHEYTMRIVDEDADFRIIESPHTWEAIGLTRRQRIVFKNLVMTLNNFAVNKN